MHLINRIAVALCVALLAVSGAYATTFTQIEGMTGWKWCSACAKGAGVATMSMTQNISSPSLDGSSARFSLGGTSPYSHALFYKRLSNNSTATHFIYDIYFSLDKPGNSSAMEYSVSQRVGYQWYRVDTQCAFNLGNWRIWNNATGHWFNTPIPCKRPAGYAWTHLVIEGARQNGKVVFISITENGHKHYINQSFSPRIMTSYDNAVIMHFQLNGDQYQRDYKAWGDRFKVTYW